MLDVLDQIKKESKDVQNQWDADRLAAITAAMAQAVKTGERQRIGMYMGVDVWVSIDDKP